VATVHEKKETTMIKVGLMGYGKAGQAVAEVLRADPRYELCWVARHTARAEAETVPGTNIPVIGLSNVSLGEWLDAHSVDALVDFSMPDAVFVYGEEVRKRKLMLVSAISAYSEKELDYVRSLGADTRVLCSPNITLGINFLIMAAKLLRSIAPFADVEILEQHFREKPEVSGTARKIAESLDVNNEHITSLRLGGIVGHHEVIFGFPYQTVRLIHNSIERKAFGTGAAFALSELAACSNGFYTFDDLLMQKVRNQLNAA
jgi:4-hydroxy-tetrahydrodipicolinate reductase